MPKPQREIVVGEVTYGNEKAWSDKHTMCFRFQDFANLKDEHGYKVSSPSIRCHGYWWKLHLYPAGINESEEGKVTLHLVLCDPPENSRTTVDASICLRLDSSNIVKTCRTEFSMHWHTCGFYELAERHDLDQSLADGALHVKVVDLQIGSEGHSIPIPRATFSKDMLNMLQSGKCADVMFAISEATFRAHRCVLESRALEFLASLVEEASGEDIPPLKVDLDPAIFYAFLHFLYSNTPPKSTSLKKNAKALLEMADEFSCCRLKLMAEAELVKSGVRTANAADLLLFFADGRNCGLLKEAALKFIVAHLDKIKASEGHARLQESNSVMNELLEAAIHPKIEAETHKIDNKTVRTLRRKLDDCDCDLDGTHAMLVKRLKADPL